MSEPESWRSRLWLDLGLALAIGGIGLTLRLAYVGEFAAHPLGRLPWVDEGAYWSRAREIGAGRWLPARPFYQDPLLPYVLYGLSKVVGPEVAHIRFALAVLGSLTPIAVFGAGRWGLGRAEGLLAGLAAAVYGPLIFSDGLLDKEGLGALVAAGALVLTVRAASVPARQLGFAAAGLAWGVFALLRANALLLAPLGTVWAGLVPLGDRAADRDALEGSKLWRGLRALSFLGGFALALTPAAVVNAVVSRPPELLLTTWQLGANFYIGNGPEATGTYVAPPFVEANPAREAGDFMAEARRRSGRPLTPGQVSRYWLDAGLQQWRDAPGTSVRLLLYKFGLLAHDFEIPDNQDAAFVRLFAAPSLALGFLSFGWISPCAALGLGVARSKRSPFWWFLVLSSLVGWGSTAVFFVVGRYRVPWMPGLLLLGAAGVVDVSARIRRGDWRGLAWRVPLLLLPATFLAWRPLDDPAPERWGHMLIVLAVADLGADRLESALDAFDDARAFGVGPALRINQLLTQGPLRAAMERLIAARRAETLPRPGDEPGLSTELQHARWLRQFPEGRAESRRRLDELLPAGTDRDRNLASRELGAWRLGETENPESRRQAAEDLALAARGPDGDDSAALLLALLLKDRTLLPRAGRSSTDLASVRLRFAHMILDR